ncbi:MAG: hypothetical protein AAGU27_05965 [Dehalobacterium sp.]
MKKSIVAAVLSGVLAGGILVSAGSIMADSSDNDQQSKPLIMEMKRGGMRELGNIGPGFMMKGQEGLETILDELVADGIITQDKADKISEFISKKFEDTKDQREEMKNMTQEERKAAKEDREAIKDENKDKRGGILTELVDEGIITQAEADAIQEKLQEKMEAQREEMAAKQKEMMEEKYSKLIEEGIISQNTADQLLAFMEEKRDTMKEQREEIKDMTEEGIKEAISKGLSTRGGYLADAVEAGIITQEEADAIQEYEQKEMKAKQETMMDEHYAKLVDDGVISEEQADEIKEFIQAKAEEIKAQMDELKDMTDDERKAFFEENKDQLKRINMLDEMVDAGIISQDQADKLAEKMPMLGHIKQRNWDSLPEQQE